MIQLWKQLLELFLVFFKIGLVSFGGGYAIIAIIQKEIITLHSWVSETLFLNIIAISQMTPGPISINAATYVGYEIHGILGSLIATFGLVIPSILFMIFISYVIEKFLTNIYMQEILIGIFIVSIGLIMSATISMYTAAIIDWFSIFIFFSALFLALKYKISSIKLLVIYGIIGIVYYGVLS